MTEILKKNTIFYSKIAKKYVFHFDVNLKLLQIDTKSQKLEFLALKS